MVFMVMKRHNMSSVDTPRSLTSDPSMAAASSYMSPKHALLGLLTRQPDQDALSVAHALPCSPAAAGMLLLRLTRHGLIQRALDPDDRLYFYSLTEKGRARLAYLTKMAEAR